VPTGEEGKKRKGKEKGSREGKREGGKSYNVSSLGDAFGQASF